MHDELLNDFLEESIDLIEKVKVNLASWNQQENKAETIDNIYRWVHTIKGGCAIFEYKETAHIAHELETFLGTLRQKADSVTPAELKRVEEGILAIESTFNEDSTCEPIFTTEPEVTEVQAESEPNFKFKTEYFKEWMEDSEAITKDLYHDGFRFFEIKLPAALSEKILAKLQEYEVFTLDTYQKEEETFCLCSINLKATPEFEEKANLIIKHYNGNWCELIEEKPAETKVDKPVASAEAAPSSSAPVRSAPNAAVTQEVLRVPLATVNSILDHIWELFLVRNQMAHLFKENKHIFKEHLSFIQQFESIDNVIERNIHELESKTMSLRLNPIKKIFDRMNKVVSEYCNQNKKDIQLITSGEGIDLDKKVLDQLNEPLIHLIRNAIDHGVEKPEDRRKAGKPVKGRVELSAQLQGNEVCIVVGDDGKGIDAKKILESAKRKNLDVSHITNDQEAVNLIFAPGFSTAEQVTDVSGRGVGMDAVKKSIQELGGNITIETVVGQGSKFKINLPLTMSVSKCLVVDIRGLEYAFSTKSVVFVEKISVNQLKKNGEDQYYEFNGKLIPCFTLGEVLPDYREEPDLPSSYTHICVTSLNGQEVAFRVDEILQTMNIVMKPLPKIVERHKYIAGVSILPGGNPIFLLNIQECLTGIMSNKRGEFHGKRVA
ncbi:MAG TPA: chemotaxis protein CheA [Bacteriovoracaceae bacterium]|nr:chemotaxis protein CheA [Bacteriovoracaceae bacterium]